MNSTLSTEEIERLKVLFVKDPCVSSYELMEAFGFNEYAKLSAAVKRTIGITIQQLRISCRMARAKQLLTLGGRPRTVAREVGYSHYSEFMAAYCQVHGVYPTGDTPKPAPVKRTFPSPAASKEPKTKRAPKDVGLVTAGDIRHLRDMW